MNELYELYFLIDYIDVFWVYRCYLKDFLIWNKVFGIYEGKYKEEI